ncbi:SH3 domain-containing protein [Helicobacter cappadocius]|uniref:SH3 domain-containing protein n=1 Tax=Helicobacter cappadocius TaxID=3063998 RepID=A0AA90PKR9_9HELI|nr:MULTISPECIES: SH3 domain-containing protein [unclassified Helicobacter]MDO7252856.1 SH3 domain-containing protein [Helicobacter sp. faydin-H75]MDP2538899.1 SH3 domain-containing protein [Helicobacter sp. faydin-H76]
MNIKSLFKLYTIPILALFFGFGLYYVVFVGTNKQKEDSIPESFNPAVLSQPEMNYKEEENKLEQSSVSASLDNGENFSTDKKSNPDKKISSENFNVSSPIYSSDVPIATNATQTPQNLDHSGIYVALGKILNIRKSPNVTSEIVGKLRYNQKIEVEMIQGDWARLKNGWVYARLLKPVESKPQPSKNTAEKPLIGFYKSLKVVNIRLEPTVSSKIVGKLVPNQIIEVKDIRDGWGKIQNGWVLLDLLSKQGDNSSL